MKMMALAALSAAAFGLSALGAQAQSENNSNKLPLTLKIGGFLPSDSGARHFGDSTQLSGGGEIALSGNETNTAIAYVDAQGAKHNGGHVYSYGIGLGVRSNAPQSFSKGVTPYGGAGLGFYTADVDQGSGNPSERKGGLGGKLFGGLQFGNNVIAELNYQWVPTAAQINGSGFGFQIGLRL
jgi:hypothetical protein